MRAVVQRVSSAEVRVENKTAGKIQNGLLVLIGISGDDDTNDITYIANKILNLRIFNDSDGKMNLNISDSGGEILVVSQFTLYGDCRKGNRPSYSKAAPPDKALGVYKQFVDELGSSGIDIKEGVFGALMEVDLVNDGPVTIMLDSERNF